MWLTAVGCSEAKFHAICFKIALISGPGRRAASSGGVPSSGRSSTSTSSSARLRAMSGVAGADAAQLGGGLSVTGSLSNFSLYIFHPYGGGGGGQKKTSLAALENTFRKAASRTGKLEWGSCAGKLEWSYCTGKLEQGSCTGKLAWGSCTGKLEWGSSTGKLE